MDAQSTLCFSSGLKVILIVAVPAALVLVAYLVFRVARAISVDQRRDLTGVNGDRAREEYSHLVAMVQVETQSQWANIAAFLVVETVILALVASVLIGKDKPDVGYAPVFALSIMGFLISLLWLAVVLRMKAYHELRVLQAKELEAHPDVPYRVFTRGADIELNGAAVADGKRVTTTLLGRIRTLFSVIFLVLSFAAAFLSAALFLLGKL
jgi:hypothetical protein